MFINMMLPNWRNTFNLSLSPCFVIKFNIINCYIRNIILFIIFNFNSSFGKNRIFIIKKTKVMSIKEIKYIHYIRKYINN